MPKEWLEENILIIGCRGNTAFDNPIVASPFFNENEYENYLERYNLSSNPRVKLDGRFPMISKMNKIYDTYQLFINEKMPDKWHFEVFKNPEMYYITLHLMP